MPSSAEHCNFCPFARLTVAEDGDTLTEDIYVKRHLFELAQEEQSLPVAAPGQETGITPERIFAARACAKLIREKVCARFYELNVRKTFSDQVSVVVVEREDDDGPEPA